MKIPMGPRAFVNSGRFSQDSQAAQLMILSLYALMSDPLQRAQLQVDGDLLGVPRLDQSDFVPLISEEHEYESLTAAAIAHHTDGGVGDAFDPAAAVQLYEEVEATKQATTAFALVYYNLRNSSSLVSLAAAICVRTLTGAASSRAQDIIRKSAMARSQRLRALSDGAGGSAASGPADASLQLAFESGTSVLIHGTFARLGVGVRWNHPRSSFSEAFREKFRPNLYSGDDYFRWSGAYSAVMRRSAARQLALWASRPLPFDMYGWHLDTVMAHSHGGNVVLEALSQTKVKLLMLAHVPIMSVDPSVWSMRAANVGRVVVLRTKADHVVLADMLKRLLFGESPSLLEPPAQLFQFEPLAGPVSSLWFGHSVFTEPSTWEKYGLYQEMNYEYQAAPMEAPVVQPDSTEPLPPVWLTF